ncbi:hypothetical protein G5714_024679 [Onychostoma macrolepis]|uniref:Uncharacterized protein n=1 Tax=Onychostoma macrolepis TaxID=369639 RepID=A0A7J6BHJ7_9TELE|nr:hypothetical protein G5714_024679 [Onychostoma macrolepis]
MKVKAAPPSRWDPRPRGRTTACLARTAGQVELERSDGTKDGELCLAGRPEETLVEARSVLTCKSTAGRWPWKSESAKECVTTHLPNQLALKMDGAGAAGPIPAADGKKKYGHRDTPTSRRAAAVALKPRARPGGAAGADLGGSSKYSNESFEGQVEKGSM